MHGSTGGSWKRSAATVTRTWAPGGNAGAVRRGLQVQRHRASSLPDRHPADPQDNTTGGEGRLGTSVVLDAESRMRAWQTPTTR